MYKSLVLLKSDYFANQHRGRSVSHEGGSCGIPRFATTISRNFSRFITYKPDLSKKSIFGGYTPITKVINQEFPNISQTYQKIFHAIKPL